MTVLAAVAGALTTAGLVCAVAAVLNPPVADGSGRPPSRLAELTRALVAPHRWRRIAAGGVLGLVVLLLTAWPVAAIAAAAAAIAAPHLLSQRPAEQRIAKLEALEQWTRRLADVLGASRALEDALMLSVRKAPPPIEDEVKALARRLRARMPTETAVRLFADDLQDPVADRVAAALILAASRRGSGVRRVLTSLADLVARDVAARREVEASRAQHRTTLRWVLVFLAGYTVLVSTRQSYSAPFDTAAGQVAMAVVAVLYAAGLWWIHRLASPEKTARLLSTGDPPDGTGGSLGVTS